MSEVKRLTNAERQCIKIALLDMGRNLAKLGYQWDPRLRDAFCHAYNAVREPGEPDARGFFRDARAEEIQGTIEQRMTNMGFALPPSVRA